MKSLGIVLASILFLTPIFAAAPATQTSPDKENAALRARVAELEAKVAQLQQQVNQLRAVPPGLRGNLVVPGPLQFNLRDGRYEVLPQPAPLATPALPPGWVPQ